MTETLLLSAWIAYAITVVRHGRRSIALAIVVRVNSRLEGERCQ